MCDGYVAFEDLRARTERVKEASDCKASKT